MLTDSYILYINICMFVCTYTCPESDQDFYHKSYYQQSSYNYT